MICQCHIKHVALRNSDIYCRNCGQPLFLPSLIETEGSWIEPVLLIALLLALGTLADYLIS
jgi:hypothetical protein